MRGFRYYLNKVMKGVFSLHILKRCVFATFDDVFDDGIVDIYTGHNDQKCEKSEI